MDLCWVYINNGKYQEAVDTTTEGLKSNPDQVWLLSNEGLALYKLKNFEEAKGVLEKDKESAKKITPEDWKVAYPGNDPAGAEEGVRDVKAAISYNLALVYKNLNETGKYLDEVDYYRSLFPAGDPKIEKIYDTL